MIDPLNIHYRQCFSTESGRLVLANMLILAGYFDSEVKTEDLAVLNFVKKILKNGGFHPADSRDHVTVSGYVNKLLEIPIRST